MATRSYIGVEHKDKSILAVYCHWDGYPEHLGLQLVTHWNSVQKAYRLLEYRGISSIDGKRVKALSGSDTTTVYVNLKEFLKDGLKGGIEYLYLYSNGHWYFAGKETKNRKFWKLESYLDTLT